MQAPPFCRSLMTGCPNPSAVSATYGTCQQSPCLKMMSGSSAPAMHLPCSHCWCLGEKTLPIAASLGFPFLSCLFPWFTLLPALPWQGWCVLCNLPSAPRQLHPLPLSSWQHLIAKLLMELGCSTHPGHPSSLPSSTVVAFLALSCRFSSSCNIPSSSASALC